MCLDKCLYIGFQDLFYYHIYIYIYIYIQNKIIRIRITVEIVEGVGSDTGGTGLEAGGRVGDIVADN